MLPVPAELVDLVEVREDQVKGDRIRAVRRDQVMVVVTVVEAIRERLRRMRLRRLERKDKPRQVTRSMW